MRDSETWMGMLRSGEASTGLAMVCKPNLLLLTPLLTFDLGGIFGQNQSVGSPEWPYAKNNLLKNGVYLSYWNFPNNQGSGLHTSSISQHFDKSAVVPYMTLYEGSIQNLVPSNATILRRSYLSVTIDWYATYSDTIGNLNWNTEVI